MRSSPRANEEGCEGSASPRQWTPSSKPSSQSLAPLQSLLKWIHFFVPMHCMWLRGQLTITWCVPTERKRSFMYADCKNKHIYTVYSNYPVKYYFFSWFAYSTDQRLQWQTENNRVDHHFHHLQFSQLHRLLLLLGDPVHWRWENLYMRFLNYNTVFLCKTDVRQQRCRSPMTNCSTPPASLGTGGEQLLKDSWDGNVPSFTWQPGEHIKPSWPVHQCCKCATSPPTAAA